MDSIKSICLIVVVMVGWSVGVAFQERVAVLRWAPDPVF